MSRDANHEHEAAAEAWRKQFWDDEASAKTDTKKPKGNGADSSGWGEPEPLISPQGAELLYPVDALPPLLRNAVLEYQEYGQQPLPLIATSALSCASLATQGLANVARDAYLVSPISLYFFAIAVSGERKTSADNRFKTPMRQWMMAQQDELQPQVDAANALYAAWESEREGLRAKIKSASGKPTAANGIDVGTLKEMLIKVEQEKPDLIITPHLFYEDTNSPTLAADLAGDWPSASLWSDEAGLVVGAHGMSDDMAMGFFALLNRLWDGNPFERDRSTARRARVQGRRFTVSLMMQPVVMARLLSTAGGASRGMGLISRFFACWPESTIGSRPYRAVSGLPHGKAFGERLQRLLALPLPLDPETPTPMALAPPILRLSARAQRVWELFHNDVEVDLGKHGEYAEVRDIGAKVAENAARLAGNFHVMENGAAGEIDSKTMFRASQVVSWHLCEARRLLATFDKPQSLSDAEILLEWLLKQPDAQPIEPRHILRVGPRALGRDVKRRDAAIDVLVAHQYLRQAPSAGKRYALNPRARSQP
jgi:hypothetical protein